MRLPYGVNLAGAWCRLTPTRGINGGVRKKRRIPPYELKLVAILDEPNPVKVKWFC